MTRRQRQGQHAAEHRHMRDRLIRRYVEATGATIMAGRQWYPAAESVVAELSNQYGIGRPTVAAVIAVLSPQTRWRQNITAARAVLEGELSTARAHCYGSNVLKAVALLGNPGGTPILGGPKVSAFWANLVGSREAVTVDVWAARAATDRDVKSLKRARYERIARAYKAAADIVGETPREFQAIIWLATRPASEYTHDLRAIHSIESEALAW